jgi:cysteine desulfurase
VRLEKSISNRFYFDYNATSPLSIKVEDFLRGGDFLFGNPSSLHLEGKKSKKYINETSKYLINLFQLSEKDFHLVYHSGASEGINSFFKGIALKAYSANERCCFFFSQSDHSCVLNLVEFLELLGHEVCLFDIDRHGHLDLENLISEIQRRDKKNIKTILNFTVINNETGVVWSFDMAEKIKNETSAIIHVDAVQLIGKIENWMKVSSKLDAYTFSGHKFGSLKGIGFSFFKRSMDIMPLISGGGQQNNLRAGTENALGIYSMKLALEELIHEFDAKNLKIAKLYIEKNLREKIEGKGEIIADHSSQRNLNTIFFLIKNMNAETLSMRFDMAGIAVSTGSACSSGIIRENRVLMSMGYSASESKSAIRISFSPVMNLDQAKENWIAIEKVLNEVLK